MLRSISALFLTAALGLATGCDDGGDDGGDSGGGSGGEDRAAAILAIEGDAAAGQTVFEGNACSIDACHGADGVSGMASPSLDASVPNASDMQIVTTFLNGKGSMPAQAQLSDQQLADVLAYVSNTFGS